MKNSLPRKKLEEILAEVLSLLDGDTVRRGQIVAYAGMSGSVSAPQVHFELRKGAKPVNPLDYLAG